MAIKAEACLKPERIPRTEANRANVRLVEQFLCEVRRRRRRNRNLETVLAGIAGARNFEEDAIAGKVSRGHEVQSENTFGRGGRNVPAQSLRGFRSLQGEQGAVIENGQRAIRQLGGQISEVGSFRSCVDDEKE